MNDKVFADTDNLVYARDAGEPKKQAIAQAWLTALWRQRRGYLGFQVLQKYYINVTQKLRPGLSTSRTRQDVRDLLLWKPITANLALLETTWTLVDCYRVAWRDAPIVAATLRAGCTLLLSDDMQHDLEVGGIHIVNPFAGDVPVPEAS